MWEERSQGDAYAYDFTVEAAGLRFFTERCAPHVIQELDVLDPLSFALPYAECRSWMRNDVKGLFP